MKTKKNLFVIFSISIFSFLMFQYGCKKNDENDNSNQTEFTEQENKILESASPFLTPSLKNSLQQEMITNQNTQGYQSYLDTLENEMIKLSNSIESTYTNNEFKNKLIALDNYFASNKSTASIDCYLKQLGLGYGASSKIEVSSGASLGLIVKLALEEKGGGGIKTIYDFVKMERRTYLFTICELGGDINVALGAALGAGVGFTGYQEYIFNLGCSDSYVYEGPLQTKEFAISGALKAILDLDIDVSIAYFNRVNDGCSGFSFIIDDCPTNLDLTPTPIKGVSFGASVGAGAGIGLLLEVSLSNIIQCSEELTDGHNSFSKNVLGRKIASMKLANEIISPMTGGIISGSNIAAAATAVYYGFHNPCDCDQNMNPIANFVIDPLYGSTAIDFEFDGSSSYDNEDPISALLVRWDWENDGNWDTDWSTDKTKTHQYENEGEYVVKMEVKDSDGRTDLTTNNVTVTGNSNTGIWSQKTNFGGTKRDNAIGFSINDKAYVGTGFEFTTVHKKDFWEYDPSTDTWTQKADFGGHERNVAVGFSIGNKGYVGTGNFFGTYYKDFWEYDPSSNTWSQKADFGGLEATDAVGFSIDNKGYVGLGWSDNDFWEYNPSTDTWTQKADFSGTAKSATVGFSIGNKGYIGLGEENGIYSKEFWEYNPALDKWTQKADFAGTSRIRAVGFSIGNKGYIGTGYDGTYKNDFWEYDQNTDVWKQINSFIDAERSGAVGFSIGNVGYIGTGRDEGSAYINDFWEYSLR